MTMTETGSPLPLLSRYAIMIDVGYIYASAGELLFSAGSRREYRVDADKLIQALTRHADDQVRGELLRVYWYDAARDRVPTIGERVHLWGVEPPYGTNQAERLVWESDTVQVLERSFVEPYFSRTPVAEPAPGPVVAPARHGLSAAAKPNPALVFGDRHASRA